MSYHISADGRPRPCEAQPGNCRLGTPGEHYTTEVQALRAAVERALERRTVPPIQDEERMNPAGLAEEIRKRTDLPPSELQRLARQYPHPYVAGSVAAHRNVDARTIATLMSIHPENLTIATRIVYNPRVPSEQFSMVYDTYVGIDREKLLYDMAHRHHLPEDISRRVLKSADAYTRGRYAKNTKNPEHIGLLAQDGEPVVHLSALGNVYAPKDILESAATRYPSDDERREAATITLDFIQKHGVKRDYFV